MVKLIDVWPDGFAQELCHGIVRARYRDSYTEPTLIEPDAVYQYTVQVNPTSNLFRVGHRMRIDISSSDFPNFDRNHNTGLNDYADGTLLSGAADDFPRPRQAVSRDAAGDTLRVCTVMARKRLYVMAVSAFGRKYF